MKKILMVLFFIFFLFSNSCYDDSRSAVLRINLGNIPAAENSSASLTDKIRSFFIKDADAASQLIVLVKAHIAVYSGDKIIASRSVDITDNLPPSTVVMHLSVSDNIKILVIGEKDSGEAYYYGFSPAVLVPGETTDVTVLVYENGVAQSSGLSWGQILNFTYNANSTLLSWNSIGIKTRYVVTRMPTTGGAETLYYEGYETQVTNSSSAYYYYLYIEFEPFMIKTVSFSALNI